MYLTQDVIRDDFASLVKQLRYMPSLHHPLDEGVRVRLVEAKKDGHRNYWFNLIGNTYRLHPNSYSVEGMGMVDSWSGCHTMNNDNNGLVFEVISLPINTMQRV